MHKIAVYGTLKSHSNSGANGNYSYLIKPHLKTGKAKFLGEDVTEPKFTMYKSGFPVIVPGGSTGISIEIYEVDDDVKNRIDSLEGFSGKPGHGHGNWYDLMQIPTKFGEAGIYFWHNPPNSGWEKVESGCF